MVRLAAAQRLQAVLGDRLGRGVAVDRAHLHAAAGSQDLEVVQGRQRGLAAGALHGDAEGQRSRPGRRRCGRRWPRPRAPGRNRQRQDGQQQQAGSDDQRTAQRPPPGLLDGLIDGLLHGAVAPWVRWIGDLLLRQGTRQLDASRPGSGLGSAASQAPPRAGQVFDAVCAPAGRLLAALSSETLQRSASALRSSAAHWLHGGEARGRVPFSGQVQPCAAV